MGIEELIRELGFRLNVKEYDKQNNIIYITCEKDIIL